MVGEKGGILPLVPGHTLRVLAFIGQDLSEGQSSYLVDPASSHMLVSKIKPCMSKYKQLVQ